MGCIDRSTEFSGTPFRKVPSGITGISPCRKRMMAMRFKRLSGGRIKPSYRLHSTQDRAGATPQTKDT